MHTIKRLQRCVHDAYQLTCDNLWWTDFWFVSLSIVTFCSFFVPLFHTLGQTIPGRWSCLAEGDSFVQYASGFVSGDMLFSYGKFTSCRIFGDLDIVSSHYISTKKPNFRAYSFFGGRHIGAKSINRDMASMAWMNHTWAMSKTPLLIGWFVGN